MGLSVSGSAAIIFVAAVIAFGTAYSAGSSGFERVNDAREAVADEDLARENSAIELASTAYFAGNATLRVDVTNTGTTTLDVTAADLLVDNAYVANATTAVGGDAETELWLPGERLRFSVDLPNRPDGVKVVVERGLADRAVV